jgi:amidohydrolase
MAGSSSQSTNAFNFKKLTLVNCMDTNEIKKLVEKYYPEMVETRRHLHRHPELSYKEYKTTEYIVERLEKLGYDVKRPLETGCVAILDGDIDSDRVIALRADIDALPITEIGEHKKEFISQNPGVAHCCGHDVHTSNLLGTARILADFKSQIKGRVVLIFQAAEEKLPGGGRLLCENGILQDLGVTEIYGLHTDPRFNPGQIGIRPGPFMARPDEFEVTVKGLGGHAAYPHKAVDPIVTAAQIVTMIQSIVSRNIDPNEPAVVTIGRIEGGTAHNIIPEEVKIWGTVRTFSDTTAHFIRDRIKEIVEGVTRAAGGSYEYNFNEGYPAVINTPWAVDNIRLRALQVFGNDSIIDLEKPIMAGEDFAFYLEHFPGAFFFLGSGSESSGAVYNWHHPMYNADEECMKTGSALMASLVLNTDH